MIDFALMQTSTPWLILKPAKPERDAASLHAEQIFSCLPAETLAKLIELASRASGPSL